MAIPVPPSAIPVTPQLGDLAWIPFSSHYSSEFDVTVTFSDGVIVQCVDQGYYPTWQVVAYGCVRVDGRFASAKSAAVQSVLPTKRVGNFSTSYRNYYVRLEDLDRKTAATIIAARLKGEVPSG